MRVEKSPLELKNFFILKTDWKFIPSKKKLNIQEIYDKYVIDLEYFIKPAGPDLFNIFVTVSINQTDQQLPGCSIFIEGVGVFMLNKKEFLEENDCKHLINFSAVSIIINSIRTYILTLTTFSPMGKYTLPAIDMNNLLAEKVKSIQNQVAQDPKGEYYKPAQRKTKV